MSQSTRLLLIEDEPDVRELVAFALEDEGFELTSCVSGAEGIERARALQPEVILLDVMMPGMDGPTTLAQLRELPHLTTTPVIFMTAKVQRDEVAKYRELGALDVIAKPFDAMSLGDQIREILADAG